MPDRRADRHRLASPAGVGRGPGAGPGHAHEAQAGAIAAVHPQPRPPLLGRRVRRRPERLLRQLRDADVNLYWELQNLGFADRAIARSRAAEQRTAALELMKVQDRVAAEVVRAEKARIAAARQMGEAARALPEAMSSLRLNLTNIRRGAGLPGVTRPIEVLQPIQALAQARADYLDAVLAYNRAQFRLYHALGQPPLPSASAPAPAPLRAVLPGR